MEELFVIAPPPPPPPPPTPEPLTVRVLELVTIKPFKSSAPPEEIVTPPVEGNVLTKPSCKVPAPTTAPPRKVLIPVSVSVLDPTLVSALALDPLMMPVMFIFPFEPPIEEAAARETAPA